MGFFSKLFRTNQKKEDSKEEKQPLQKEAEQVKKRALKINPYLENLKITNSNGVRKTVFLYWCRKGQSIGEIYDYPQYFKYDYHITNIVDFHKKMIQDGYLTPPDKKDILSSLKVDQLKMILTENEQKTTGRKQELIERINNNITLQKINEIVKTDNIEYFLSEKGDAYLKENSGYIWFHQHKNLDISLTEYNSMRNRLNNSTDFINVITSILNERIAHKQSTYFIHLCLAEIFEKRGEHEAALLQLLYVLHDNLRHSASFPDPIIPPETAERIRGYEEYFDESFINQLFKSCLPRSSCNKQVFSKVLDVLFKGEDVDKKKYQAIKAEIKNNEQYINISTETSKQ